MADDVVRNMVPFSIESTNLHGDDSILGGLSAATQDSKLADVEYKCMSKTKIEGLINHWHGRLRRFRRGDQNDASVLMASPTGRKIMISSVEQYLAEWGNSNWIDEAEIEMLASDLAALWPNDAKKMNIVTNSKNTKLVHAAEIFNRTFADSFHQEEAKLSDEMEAYSRAAATG